MVQVGGIEMALRNIGVVALTSMFTLLGCGSADGGGDTEVLEAGLNEWLALQYPDGVPVDGSSVEFDDTDGAMAVFDGQSVSGTIDFADADAPVDAVCMAFGDPSNATCVPTTNPGATASGGTSGTASLEIMLPPELCGNLSQICHDIRCYEFARTSSGTFTRGNIAHLAAACGGCDEPSCRSLVGDMCELGDFCLADADCLADEVCFTGQCVGAGALRFSLSWGASTDFDLHVMTPLGNVISFRNRTADTGTLDVDDVSGGPGSVENVFFTDPPSGSYEYWVDRFSGPGGSWSISVFEGTTLRETKSGTLGSNDDESTHFTVAVTP